jgi:ribose transport system permease protein
MSVLAPFIGLAVVMAIFYAIPPHRSVSLLDVRTIAVHTVIVGTCAMGMTLIIISGGIDLSVGSAIALCSVMAALTLAQGHPVAAAVAVAIGTGALCGLYNGLLVTGLRLPPFIATLGTLGFFRGVAKWISNSQPVNAPTHGLELWVQPVPNADWLVFAPAVWVTLGLAVLMAVVLRYSLLGRYAFAIGSNEATARLCGIRVPRVKVFIYITAGLLVGLAGLLQFARLTQGDPTVAVGLELDVIAAVVIGGGSLAGGQGSIVGTLTGAFLMAYLRNRCTALLWPNYIQEIIVGHIIIIAVAIDQWRMRRAT